jgi:hypothetical protein
MKNRRALSLGCLKKWVAVVVQLHNIEKKRFEWTVVTCRDSLIDTPRGDWTVTDCRKKKGGDSADSATASGPKWT